MFLDISKDVKKIKVFRKMHLTYLNGHPLINSKFDPVSLFTVIRKEVKNVNKIFKSSLLSVTYVFVSLTLLHRTISHVK